MQKFLLFNLLLISLVVTYLVIGNISVRSNSEPNVILIMSDDQGWGDLSFNGNKNLNTPNIDAIAKSGVSFDYFYVSPVCSPTRAEILTGRYHLRGGINGTSEGKERLNLDETTIAQIFKSAGYKTGAFGKWHNGTQFPYHPNARGFDEFYGFTSGHWGDYFNPPLDHNGKLVTGDGFIIDDFTDKAIDFIKTNQENPFFLYIPYNTPHVPMQVPDRWWNAFKEKEIIYRSNDPDKEDLNFTRATLAMCENIDWNVGRILDVLEESNLQNNTIVVFLNDNGPHSERWNGGLKGGKGSTDEGGVRSPLFIRWPEIIPAGKQVKPIAGAIDLLPTLTDLAGIDYHFKNPLDGLSLKKLILEDNLILEDRLIFSAWNGKTSVRNNQFRLDHEGNLFDIEKDPGQSINLTNEHFKIAETLKKEVDLWNQEMALEMKDLVRPFPLGYPGSDITQFPVRDAISLGNIERSNRFPNDSYFTNWTSLNDRIIWDIAVMEEGNYDVEVYYTCPEMDLGSLIELQIGKSKIRGNVVTANNPELRGMENDRTERFISYVKDFKPMNLGNIHLKKGNSQMILKALEIKGSQVMDVRSIVFKKTKSG
ncbi:MAG: arylsulfatase [Cyclobacteriaceae bacterium]